MHLRRAALVVAAVLVGSAVHPAAAVRPAARQVTAAAADTTVAARLAALPAELHLADSSLRVVNLYKLQGEILLAAAGSPVDSTIARLVREVYAPYTRFWNGYLGDEAAFRSWAGDLLVPEHPVHTRLAPLLATGLDRRFIEGVEWIERTTGRRPEGTWYIVFGPGWTDMGGLGDIGMVADFSRMRPDSAAIANLLPHELTHQVHGAAAGRAGDPGAGTVLERIISEGFASYVAWIHGAGARTPAQSLMYGDAEWEWALAHESELLAAMEPLFGSRDRADLELVASRGAEIIPGAPGAAGYFLGFRIVQAHVARNGPESWREIYDLPVADVLAAFRP